MRTMLLHVNQSNGRSKGLSQGPTRIDKKSHETNSIVSTVSTISERSLQYPRTQRVAMAESGRRREQDVKAKQQLGSMSHADEPRDKLSEGSPVTISNISHYINTVLRGPHQNPPNAGCMRGSGLCKFACLPSNAAATSQTAEKVWIACATEFRSECLRKVTSIIFPRSRPDTDYSQGATTVTVGIDSHLV